MRSKRLLSTCSSAIFALRATVPFFVSTSPFLVSSYAPLRIKPTFTTAAHRSSSCLFSTAAVTAEESIATEEELADEPASEGSVLIQASPGSILSVVRVRDGESSSNNEGGESVEHRSQASDVTGHKVVFDNGSTGVVVAQRPPLAFCLCDSTTMAKGSAPNNGSATFSKLRAQLSLPSSIMSQSGGGIMVDCFGNVLEMSDENGSVKSVVAETENDPSSSDNLAVVKRDIFAAIPKVSDIALIDEPMLTGHTMVDALAPIGKGQNMLLVGPSQDIQGLALDSVTTQQQQQQQSGGQAANSKCVFALTTTVKAERLHVVNQLKEAGVLDDMIIVCARDIPEEESDDEDDKTKNKGKDGVGVISNVEIQSAAEAVAVAAAAAAIGEGFALQNDDSQETKNAFVVVDNLDSHKTLWDYSTRSLVDVYGLDAVVRDDKNGGASSEMRAFYSAIIQRAAKFNAKKGGGSVTLLLMTNWNNENGGDDEEENTTFELKDFDQMSEKIKARIAMLSKAGIPLSVANLRKIEVPTPKASKSEENRRMALQHIDDLISMSDGQIWLDPQRQVSRPPLDPQRSITRVGIGADTESRADAPALRGLTGGMRFELAQASDLMNESGNNNKNNDGEQASYSKTSADLKQVTRRDSWLLAMYQEYGNCRTLAQECVVLLAATNGELDKAVQRGALAGTDEGNDVMKRLLDFTEELAPGALSEINTTLDLSNESRSALESVISSFFVSY